MLGRYLAENHALDLQNAVRMSLKDGINQADVNLKGVSGKAKGVATIVTLAALAAIVIFVVVIILVT